MTRSWPSLTNPGYSNSPKAPHQKDEGKASLTDLAILSHHTTWVLHLDRYGVGSRESFRNPKKRKHQNRTSNLLVLFLSRKDCLAVIDQAC